MEMVISAPDMKYPKMLRNLIAEIIKTGVAPTEVTHAVAECIGKTDKTAWGKLYDGAIVTVEEAIAINKRFFNGKMSIAYLFSV